MQQFIQTNSHKSLFGCDQYHYLSFYMLNNDNIALVGYSLLRQKVIHFSLIFFHNNKNNSKSIKSLVYLRIEPDSWYCEVNESSECTGNMFIYISHVFGGYFQESQACEISITSIFIYRIPNTSENFSIGKVFNLVVFKDPQILKALIKTCTVLLMICSLMIG